MSVDVLKPALKTFEDHKDQLLETAAGRWVLIRDGEIVGTYETQSEAAAEGYRRFGNVPFLVKQVLLREIAQNFVSHAVRN